MNWRGILTRCILYPLAFALPPAIVGSFLAISHEKPALTQISAAEMRRIPTRPAPPHPRPALTAVILLDSGGARLTELLGAYAVLGASHRFTVVTAAPDRTAVPLSGALTAIPDVALADAPAADLIVLPTITDPRSPALIAWLRAHSERAEAILCLGEGARLAIYAGILRKREATTDSLAIEELRKLEPKSRWLVGERAIADDDLITSEGYTGAIDGALLAVRRIAGPAAAEETAKRLGYLVRPNGSVPNPRAFRPTAGELAAQLAHAAFDPERLRVSVLGYPGVSELGLAAALELYPRTQSLVVESVAAGDPPAFVTDHGLSLIASQRAIDERSAADLLIVPALGETAADAPPAAPGDTAPARAIDPGLRPEGGVRPAQAPEIRDWIKRGNVSVKSFLLETPGNAWDRNLVLIRHLKGDVLAQAAAKGVRWPTASPLTETSAGAWPLELLLQPLLLGLAGVALAYALDSALRRRKTHI